MEAVTDALLEEMARAIEEAVAPRLVILFGSYARGTASADSDVDLLIVEDEPFGIGRSRRREIARIRAALASFRVPKDILVFGTDEVGCVKEGSSMKDPEHARLMLGLARRDLKALAGMTDMQDFEDPIVLFDTLIWVQRRVCSFPGRSKPAGAPARQRETASPVLHSIAFCGG